MFNPIFWKFQTLKSLNKTELFLSQILKCLKSAQGTSLFSWMYIFVGGGRRHDSVTRVSLRGLIGNHLSTSLALDIFWLTINLRAVWEKIILAHNLFERLWENPVGCRWEVGLHIMGKCVLSKWLHVLKRNWCLKNSFTFHQPMPIRTMQLNMISFQFARKTNSWRPFD